MTEGLTGPAGPWQLVILAKAPRAGAVKTRLCPPLTHEEAAHLAAAALTDTMAAALGSSASRRLLVLAGDPGPWRHRGFEVLTQRGDGLAERLTHAFEDAAALSDLPTLLVGMDTPQVRAEELDRAAGPLVREETETVLGPALDGGFWAVGTRRPRPGLFTAVPMSTPRTGALQLQRIEDLALSCRLLPVRRDVDEWDDALAVAAAAPWTAFSSLVTGELAGRLARAGARA